MNKIITVITFVLLAVFVGQAQAQTPSSAPAAEDKSAISEKLNEEINNLKEKIASRVSELNLVEKRGIIGTVTEVSGNQVTISDVSGKTRFIDVDEITKFSSPSTKTFGISDLTKGTRISSLGLYNKQSKRLLARFVNATVDPVYVSGTIGTVDTKNFQLTIISENQKASRIDNQNTTKILNYDKDAGFTKLGFSKLIAGDRIFVMGYPDKTDKSLIVADRIVVIPSLPKDGNVVLPEQSESISPTVAPLRR
jgi:hypothetical protein